MNIENINFVQIDNYRLTINLELYKTLKDVIQAKLTENQTISLVEKLKLLTSSKENFDDKVSILYKGVDDISNNEKTREKIKQLIDNSILKEENLAIFKLALNLDRFKKIILEQSKLVAEGFQLTEDIHIMDFQYDYNMLHLPYSIRVTGALLIKALFEEVNIRKNVLYKPLIEDLGKIASLDADAILQIIYAESASQSIRSSSGSSYESRLEEVLKNNNIMYKNQSFDANLEAVEYDFVLMRNGKKIGVSAKRTLRERYKQNHEDVDKLEVDAMFLITLGIDLNEDKIRYITHKEGNHIFVASDLYDKTSFFQKNENVYPLNLLTNNLIDKILKVK
ncbi:hypothetical protein ACE193_09650 [Bernardetia sp. OM2101]|uniref:hypothetical protein n=1 Tax=Bernardetia sp. OM2101 TaxID=3344876 RepID=UPI0035CF263E